MGTFWLVSHIILWVFVLFIAFVLLGALRALALLRWRMAELEATTPSRINRRGLKPGTKSPDFTLPSVTGTEVALNDFAGCKVLLVFTQDGCSPCHQIMSELARFCNGDVQILVVNNGDPENGRKWAEEFQQAFPILTQQHFRISRQYEVFATPFAFLINEKGVIQSKGIVNNRQQISFVLNGNGEDARHREGEAEHEELRMETGDRIV